MNTQIIHDQYKVATLFLINEPKKLSGPVIDDGVISDFSKNGASMLRENV